VNRARNELGERGRSPERQGADGKTYQAQRESLYDVIEAKAKELGGELTMHPTIAGLYIVRKGNEIIAKGGTLRDVKRALDRGIEWDDVEPPRRELTFCDSLLTVWEDAPPEERALFVRSVCPEILEYIPPAEWALDDEA
jgi:hypothetical protein